MPKLVNRGPAGLLKKDGGTGGAKLVNRGGAGLLDSAKPASDGKEPEGVPRPPKGPKDRIRCAGSVLPIAKLNPDPENARLHPERNMEAIEDSLNLYGQMSPVTVRKSDMTVMKGNGTMEAAKRLGWTKLACSVIDMDHVESVGYGLADNRTAEHARWDFEVVARLSKIIEEAGGQAVGWSQEEMTAARMMLQGPTAPIDFPEVDETIETEHVCPKCGYAFSGGEVREKANGEA